MNFFGTIEQIHMRTFAKMDEVVRGNVLDLYNDVVQGTPVDKGQARGNWHAGINEKITKVNEIDSLSEANSYNTSQQTQIQSGVNRKTRTINITNNLSYIRKLEYGGYPNPPKKGTGKTVNGYSKKAPEGWVRQSVQRQRSNLDKVISQLNKK